MKTNLYRWFVGMQIGCVALTGCHPTQPFFLGERGDLAHYIDRAQNIEYPDLKSEPLPEATQSYEPFSLDNQKFDYLDLSLEECISYALVNKHIAHTLQGTQRQNADMAATILSSPSGQLVSDNDPAIAATTTNSQGLVVDQNGNRTLPRGAARANQVGGVEDALSEFDAQFSSFLSYNTTDRARNVGAGNVFNPQFYQAKDTTGQMALSKRMATGGVTTIRSQTIYANNNIPTQSSGAGNFGRAVPTDFTQILEVQVQHPLMKNRGTLVNRIPILLARINEDTAIGVWEQGVRNTVRDVELAYWDLYASYYNVDTAKTARESAALAHKIASDKRMIAGQAADAEAQARNTLHTFEAQHYAAISGGGAGNDPGLFGNELKLRVLMGWAATDGRLIRPSDKPALAKAEFDWDSVKAEVLTRNIDLRQQKWLIKAKELELASARNQALPDVNVSLIYRWLGVGGSLVKSQGGNPPFPQGGGAASAFEELFGGNYQEGAVRLEYTPNALGSRRQLNDIMNKQLSLASEHRKLEAREMAAIAKLSSLWQQADSLHKQMTQQFQAFNAAQRLVEVNQDKFNLGNTTQDGHIDALLRAQQTRATAGQAYIRALAEYNKSLVEIHALKGSLLEYNNIALEEGLWPEKAYWDAHEHARERDAARHFDYGASRPSVISRGEYRQDQGTANAQARPASRVKTIDPNSAEPESVKPRGAKPLLDEMDEAPEKQANFETKSKFKWNQ